MSQLPSFLDSIEAKMREVSSKVAFPNNGGCAVIALAGYRWIEENFVDSSHKVDILFLFQDTDFDDNEKNRITNNLAGSCTHCVLQVGENKYLDSDGLHCWEDLVDDFDVTSEIVMSPECTLWAINHCSWHCLFDRGRALHVLKNIFGKESVKGIKKHFKINDKPCPEQAPLEAKRGLL